MSSKYLGETFDIHGGGWTFSSRTTKAKLRKAPLPTAITGALLDAQ